MSNQGYGRNPYWSPEFTGRKPSFNDMGAMRLNPWNELNQGLVAWWLMNEGAGNICFDSTGKYAASLGTGQGWGIDKEKSLFISGNPSVVAATIPTYLGSHTVICEFRRTEMGNISNYQIALSYGDGSGNNTIWMGYMNDGYLTASHSSTYNDMKDLRYRHDNYNHRLVGIRLSYYFTAYSDGLYLGFTSDGVGDRTSDIITLGNYPSTSLGFPGYIKQFLIYNRALTSEEVLEDYLHPYGTPSNPRFIVMPQRTWFVPSVAGGATRTALNTRASNLGMEVGMGWRMRL